VAVAKERLKSPRARLFVALDLPEDVRDGLADWQRREVTAAELRPVRPETIHMTLAFLGWHPEKRIGDIAAAALDGLESSAPEVRLEPDPIPVGRSKSRPNLFAVEAESPGAIELQAEVESRLVEAGFHTPEKRDFWPHLTVARVRKERLPAGGGDKRGKRRRGRQMRVETPPGPLPDALLQPFFSDRVALYRSLLRPSGAEYVSMAHEELPIRGGGKAS
jgi:RNA 2',3'-cyclic 3'-phosphodiesterase